MSANILLQEFHALTEAFSPATLLTPAQVFSCEICKILKKTYFEEHLRKTASTLSNVCDGDFFSMKIFNYDLFLFLNM